MSHTWEIFDQIGSSAPDSTGKLDAKVDHLVSAAMERIADGLAGMSQDALREGAAAARSALDRLDDRVPMDPTSAMFIVGRLASAADLLGYAASRSAHDDALTKARRSPYAQILSELAKQPLRNIDLGNRLHKADASMCRLLKELRDLELVASQRRGRDVFNVLTPIGRLTVEEGVQNAQRAPLETTNLVDFTASQKPQLANMTPRTPVAGTELPRLSTA